jgi:hypothetical protein
MFYEEVKAMRNGIGILTIAVLIAVAQSAAGQGASQSAQSQSQSASQTQSPSQTAAKPSTAPPQAQKESVAEAARKAREAQKNAPKTSSVFTNDNIAAAATGTINVVGNASAPAPGATASAQTVQVTAPAAAGADEAAWRQRFADARAKLQQDQAELAVMQRELSQLQLQYYPDPNKALKQSVTNDDTYKKQQAIAAKQKQIQADQQALSNLEDDLRKAGGDSSWARE